MSSSFTRALECGLVAAVLILSGGDDDGAAGGKGGTSAGGGGTAGAGPCEPTVESVQGIFLQSCADGNCHYAAQPAVGLDLASPGLEARLVEQPSAICDRILVVPSMPAESFLLDKLQLSTPQCGGPMPADSPLSQQQITCVADWIAKMAPGCETCGGSSCVDLQTDSSNCSSCGKACPGASHCEGGACICTGAELLCGASCVNTDTDPQHCGACSSPCDPGTVCSLGQCKTGCDGALTKCGASCVDTQTSSQHCGGCDKPCGADETCQAGACGCGDTQTDPSNCGTCGNVCAPGQSCVGGKCTCGSGVSFAQAVQPFFNSSCINNGCHGGVKPKEGLDLQDGKSHTGLVGVASKQCSQRLLVAPGDPAASYLVDKLTGSNLCAGTIMPKAGGVPPAQVEAISNWICAGAPNN